MNNNVEITVHTQEEVAKIGNLFGIFFEDLNHAADGGLYAELIQNRSFEFDPIDNENYNALTAWEKVLLGNGTANISVEAEYPLNERNRNYLSIEILSEGDGVGIMNLGYNTGIPVTQGSDYHFSCYARRDTSFDEPIYVAIQSKDGVVYGETKIVVNSEKWEKYEGKITTNDMDYSSRLVIVTKGKGKFFLDMVSLFPVNTFHGRTNGLREDIAKLIADLKPKFMRFPGGCLVHDGSLNPNDRDSMYRWKNTIGDVEQRPARRSGWRYNQTFGLGYYEYFQFCEDIGAKPIPILPAGYDPHHKRITPFDELQPWIDDALDLIEFANGDTSTIWGAKRAEIGHPEPFGLEYIGIGNEEVGEPFFERYPYFHKAIKAKYPDIKIINTSGPCAAGGEFERGWKCAVDNKSDVVDEHYYQAPEWFLANYHRYDDYKTDGPKAFLGEYATWGNTYYNALVEAAYMTGLEKNARAVELACYAPMLCNVDYVNWKPDMIWFNNHEVYGTPNYYVQKLFMNHQGDLLLKTSDNGLDKIEPTYRPITGEICLSTDGCTARFTDISVKNNKSGEILSFPDKSGVIEIDSGCEISLGQVQWEDYTLRFKAKKISGIKGFLFTFGKQNFENRYFWEIGGWQNQDSMVSSAISARNSCLTHSLFSVDTDTEYDVALKISGRHICTFIDDKLINETEDLLPVIESLYYTASAESLSGDIILKVANVQNSQVSAKIVLDGMQDKKYTVQVYEMSGYLPEDENSFSDPEFVVPVKKTMLIDHQKFIFDFQKQSVTVFRLNQK